MKNGQSSLNEFYDNNVYNNFNINIYKDQLKTTIKLINQDIHHIDEILRKNAGAYYLLCSEERRETELERVKNIYQILIDKTWLESKDLEKEFGVLVYKGRDTILKKLANFSNQKMRLQNVKEDIRRILTDKKNNTIECDEKITTKEQSEKLEIKQIEEEKNHEYLNSLLHKVKLEYEAKSAEFVQLEKNTQAIKDKLNNLNIEKDNLLQILAELESSNKILSNKVSNLRDSKQSLLSTINNLKDSNDSLLIQSMELDTINKGLRQKLVNSSSGISETIENKFQETEDKVLKYNNELIKIQNDFKIYLFEQARYTNYLDDVKSIVNTTLPYNNGVCIQGFKGKLKEIHQSNPRSITSILINLIEVLQEKPRSENIKLAIKDLSKDDQRYLNDAIDFLCFYEHCNSKISYHASWTKYEKLLEKIVPIQCQGFIFEAIQIEAQIHKAEFASKNSTEQMIQLDSRSNNQISNFCAKLE